MPGAQPRARRRRSIASGCMPTWRRGSPNTRSRSKIASDCWCTPERTLTACMPDRGTARGDAAAPRARDARERSRRIQSGRRGHPGAAHAAASRAGRVAHRSRRAGAQRRTDAGAEGAGAAPPAHRRRAARRRNRAARGERRRANGAIRPSRSRRANIISARSCRWRRCAARASWCSTSPTTGSIGPCSMPIYSCGGGAGYERPRQTRSHLRRRR